MTNARDKANIPVLNFQSKGIDDNADATAITIDSSENVGIKNTTPSNFNASARQLVVGSGSGDNGITIFAGTSNNSSLFLADGTTATNGYRGSINYLHNGDALTLHANATETMRLTNGKIGIGTSAPTSLLSLEANSPDIMFTDTSGGTDSKKWRVFGLDSDFRIGCRNDANSSGQTALQISRSGATITDQRFSTGGAERMRLTDTALGIGTTSMDGILHLDDGATTKLIIEKDGGGAGSLIFHNDGSQTSYIQLDASENMVHYGGSGVEQHFYSGGSERVRIPSGGGLLIGKTSSGIATAGFEVFSGGDFQATKSGSTIAQLNRLTNDGDVLRIKKDGTTKHVMKTNAVGILTDNPTTALDVNGTVKATTFQGDGSALTNLPGGGASYLTTSTTTTTSQTNPSSSYGTILTRTFTIPSGKTATVWASAGTHGMYEGSSGQAQGRITLSGASSQTGSDVGGHRGSFSNYAGEFSITQGFRITTAGSHTINYQMKEINGEVRINDSSGESAYLSITVFQE